MIESVKDALDQKIINGELQDFTIDYFLPLLQAINLSNEADIDRLYQQLLDHLPQVSICDDPALNFKYQLSRLADCITAIDDSNLEVFVDSFEFADKLRQFIFLTKHLNSFAIKTQTIIAKQLMQKGVGFTSIDKRYEHVYLSEFNYLFETNTSWKMNVMDLYRQLFEVLYDKVAQPVDLKEPFNFFSSLLDEFYFKFKSYLEQLIQHNLDLRVIRPNPNFISIHCA